MTDVRYIPLADALADVRRAGNDLLDFALYGQIDPPERRAAVEKRWRDTANYLDELCGALYDAGRQPPPDRWLTLIRDLRNALDGFSKPAQWSAMVGWNCTYYGDDPLGDARRLVEKADQTLRTACCEDPKVLGGRCDSCGTWMDDALACPDCGSLLRGVHTSTCLRQTREGP